MADATPKPVVFLAFANDRDDTVGYLRNLPDEARRLREVLESAEQAGLCEVVVRSNCTAGDIFKVFQDPRYRNRVAILHYGGHANGYELLLESAAGNAAAADGGGLARFLGQQQGLHLVFLNGCSTQQQTEGLLDVNVSAVISTSRAIDDQVATDFSYQFYQGLAGGASIRTAYNEAEASVQTSQGGNTRGLYFGNKDDSKSQPEADRWPWNLYLRKGSERADQWNLPEAVKNPLFGLPPLPEQDLPQNPYRHLNWFTRKDAEVFFGRGHQIRELYDRLTAPRTPPIILFYGQSGVGKSSVLDAGLIPRLEQDYEVRYLRRGAGGLLHTLQQAFLPEATDVPIETAWRAKEEQLQKPLIVFLDQVEELFTRPLADVPDELNQLLKVVKAIFCDSNGRPQGKLVLGFRKEWLAELEARMIADELPRTKVFLEPLDRRGIIDVVRGPARSTRLRERYGLTVEDGLAEIIADDLLEDRGSAIGPTLQILLTKMWAKSTETNYEHPQFSHDLYRQLRRDGILLRDFLNQQIAAFRLRSPEAVDSGLLLDIVALHTTPLSTADQRSVEVLQQQYAHLGAALPAILQHCQDLYLLTVAASAQKESVKTTRLSHDTLAPIVREQFDQSDKPGQRARRILDNRSVDWQQDREGTPLDEADLKVVERGASGTRALSGTELRLVEASRNLRARLKRLRIILTIAGAVAVAIIAVTAAVALWQWSEAEAARITAIEANAKAIKERDAKEVARKDAETAKGKALAQLVKANHNLGLALLERANKYAEEGKYTHAYVTAGRAVGFDGCGGPIKAFAPLLKTETEAFLQGSTIARHSAALAHWPERILFKTNEGMAESVSLAVDPIGHRLAVEKEIGETHILDVETGDTILKLEGYTSKVTEFQFSQSGMLATGHLDGTVLLWDLTTLQNRVITKGSGSTFRLAFSPDEKLLAMTGQSEDNSCLWDLETNNLRFQLSEPGDPVYSVAFGANNRHLVTGTQSGLVKIHELDSGRVVSFQAHSSFVWSIAFHPDGDRFATGGRDHMVKSWSLFEAMKASSSTKPLGTIEAHQGQVNRVRYSGDGKILASSSWDSTARLSDALTMQPLASLDTHHEKVNQLEFVPGDSTRLVTADQKGIVRIWKIPRDRLAPMHLNAHSRPIGALAVHPKTNFIASGGWDGKVLLWDRETGASQLLYPKPADNAPNTAFITALQFSPSGERLFAAGNDGRIRAINISDRSIDFIAEDQLATWIQGVAVSPDGKALASTGWDGKVKIWNVLTAERIAVLDAHPTLAMAVSFTGTLLISSGGDGCICGWDRTASYKRLWQRQVHEKGTWFGIVVSSDGKYIVSAGLDGKICKTEIDSGKTVTTLDAGVKLNKPLALTADMTRVAVSCFDGTVRIWDLNAGRQLAILPDRNEYLFTLALSSDDRWVAFPGENGTIRFLNMQLPGVPKLDESQFHFDGLEVIFAPPGDAPDHPQRQQL